MSWTFCWPEVYLEQLQCSPLTLFPSYSSLPPKSSRCSSGDGQIRSALAKAHDVIHFTFPSSLSGSFSPTLVYKQNTRERKERKKKNYENVKPTERAPQRGSAQHWAGFIVYFLECWSCWREVKESPNSLQFLSVELSGLLLYKHTGFLVK